jgi:phosphatidylglycerophosphate synthase
VSAPGPRPPDEEPRPARPTLAELRAVSQPESTMSRRNAEHWLARLFLRKVSLRITRELLRTRVTANQLTDLMIVVGLLAALAAGFTGLVSAIVAFVLVQVYFLLDLCDGEVARWRRTPSVTGVYLDRVGAYVVEAALLTAYGFRAGGDHLGGWTSAGLAAALFAILIKAETDLVDVARVRTGRTAASDDSATPRSASFGAMRRAAQLLKIHQLIGALESSLLLLVAAIVDAATGTHRGSQALTILMLAIAAVMVVLHLASILASRRLA